MSTVIEITIAATGLLLSIATLIGLLARYVLLPWLKDQLINPGLDKLEEIRDDMRAMARAYDGHLEWSQGEVDRIWDAIDELRRYRNA